MKIETKLVDDCRSLDRTVITMDFYELNNFVCLIIPYALQGMKETFKKEVKEGFFTDRSKREIRKLKEMRDSLDKCLDEMIEH